MSKLSWGEPTIEFCKLENGTLPSNPVWKAMPEIKQGTTALETQQGDRTEAYDEGGDVVDVHTAKSRYSLTFQVYIQKGQDKPLEDNDGVVTDDYAVRLTPEDPNATGFIMPRCSVSVQESWSSADGGLWTYTFNGVKATEGKTLQKWVKGASA